MENTSCPCQTIGYDLDMTMSKCKYKCQFIHVNATKGVKIKPSWPRVSCKVIRLSHKWIYPFLFRDKIRLNLDYQKGHQEHMLEKEAPLNLFFLHCLHARMKRVSCRQQPDTGQQWTWLLGQKITAHIIDHHRIHNILYGGFSLFLLGALYM